MAGANAEAATEADVPTTAYDLARELVSRDAGCAFLEDEEDGILEGDEEDEYGEEDPSYHDDLEGFEDWHMDDDLGDHEGMDGHGEYDEGDWNPDAPDDLPELIFTEGCDEEAVDIAPCISLQHCNRALNVSGSSHDSSRGGDVDAVRVMLLGGT
ncbi:hypothetical protein T484DRAFT_1812064 [Baffinella frigidus]|nr:hypothetical protein T484DRAFT_1812064 [Cryptophyta sp. CCMP2293]